MVMHVFNPRTGEVEEGLHSEFQASTGYKETVSKTNKQKKPKQINKQTIYPPIFKRLYCSMIQRIK